MKKVHPVPPPPLSLRPIGILCLALLGGGAFAQSAVLGHVEGSAAFSAQGDDEWMELEDRRNLRKGERLWTDPGSRVELQAGQHVLRLDGQSHLGVDALQAGATQISLRKGSLQAHVGTLGTMENFEVGTPNLAFRAKAPGRYRVDVDARRGVTQVSVLEGLAKVYGENAEERELQAGQRMTFAGRVLAPAAALRGAEADAFDRWVLARERPAATPPAAAAATPPSVPAVAGAPATATQRPTQAMGSARKPADTEEAQQAEDDDVQERARQRQARRDAQRREQARGGDAWARHEAWVRQQKALAEQWRRDHENWLRYNEGRPPAYPLQQQGIPARRVG